MGLTGDILHTLFQKWHVIPKLGVCFVVWDLTWHKICSHLLSTQPSCSQANIIAVVMLARVTKCCEEKTKEAAGDTVWQAWDCQLLQDPDKHLCEVLSPGTCCCCVPGCLPNSLILVCLRWSGGKNVKLVALYLPPALAHHLFPRGLCLFWLYANGENWICLAAAAECCFSP